MMKEMTTILIGSNPGRGSTFRYISIPIVSIYLIDLFSWGIAILSIYYQPFIKGCFFCGFSSIVGRSINLEFANALDE